MSLFFIFGMLAQTGVCAGEEESGNTMPADVAAPVKAGQEETNNVVVARVNGADITADALKSMMKHMIGRKGQGSPRPEDVEALRKKALDRLIFQELAYQKAMAQGLTADPKEVDSTLTALKTKLGGEKAYEAFLKEQAENEAGLRRQIERGLVIKQIFDKKVIEGISISEDELRKEYERDKEAYFRPEKVVVLDIVFFLDTHDKASIAKAEKVREMVEDEENKDPWKLVPDGTFVVRELEINKQREKELYEAAIKLKPGELSGVVTTPDSLHVLKLKQYAPEKQFTFDEVKKAIEAKLKVKAEKERLREWETELREGAKIEMVVAGDDVKQ